MSLKHDLFTTFDRVYVISLERSADRLARFSKKLDETNWPFRPVEVYKGIDGNKVMPPSWYQSGGNAWGCLRGHMGILERCLNEGVNSVLIMEDDAYFFRPEAFIDDMQKLVSGAPDWECLFIGGQHHQDPIRHSDGIDKCVDTQRTHAYALRGKIIADLYQFWADCKTHCDWPLGRFTAKYRTYAPDPFLLGQDEGLSLISGSNNPKKIWVKPKGNEPVYWFRNTPREVIEQLREKFHFGRNRDEQGRDVGLNEVANNFSVRAKLMKMKEWISLIDWESISMNAYTSIWHDGIDEETVRKAAGDRLIELNNQTVESALSIFEPKAGSSAA